MFSIMAHNRRRGWQNWKNNWREDSRDSFFSIMRAIFSLIMRAIIENMIGPDYVLCHTPRVLRIIGERMIFLKLTSKGAMALLISVVAFLWLWKIREKIEHSFCTTSNFNVTYCLPQKSNSEIDNFWKHVQWFRPVSSHCFVKLREECLQKGHFTRVNPASGIDYFCRGNL